MHDELLFASEPNKPAPADAALPAWKIAVIEDDKQLVIETVCAWRDIDALHAIRDAARGAP